MNNDENISHDLTAYRKSALKGMKWLARQLDDDGSYGSDVEDLASYYKSPWLYLVSGRLGRAHRVLDHLKATFLENDGDFTTAPGMKSENGAFNEFWPYINAWIAMGGQKLGRFDIARPAYEYVQTYFHRDFGGFTLHAPYNKGDNMMGGFITAHLGLASLYFGAFDRARRAGDFLLDLMERQPALDAGLYLRIDNSGALVTDFPAELAPFYFVRADEPYQLYFLIGYPVGYLAKLYDATGEEKYLEGARAYLDFARSCDASLYRFHFSHKVAWGAAAVARHTGDAEDTEVATRIADYLVSIQDESGGWLIHEPTHTSLDQTAEIALWLLEIAGELR